MRGTTSKGELRSGGSSNKSRDCRKGPKGNLSWAHRALHVPRGEGLHRPGRDFLGTEAGGHQAADTFISCSNL